MDQYIHPLENLLSEHGSVTLSFVSSKLNLTFDKSKELAHLFVHKNKDYSVLYSVQYNVDDSNFKMCTVGYDELTDLSSKYKTLKSNVYAIRNNNYDMNKVFTQLFNNSFKLSQEEMCKSSENNTLYIPSFVNLRISNIKVRNFETRPPTEPYVREATVKKETKPPPLAFNHEPSTLKKEFTEKKEKMDLFDKDDKEPSTDDKPRVTTKSTKHVNENKRKLDNTKNPDKSPKPVSDTKKLKVKQEPEVIEVDMDDKLFVEEPNQEPEQPTTVEQPTTIKFVEKVSKENTYIENGYFVVEESEDYVEVVKDLKPTQEHKKQYAHDNKSSTNGMNSANGLNTKKIDTSRSDTKKKLNQSSIMSFFKK